MSRGGTRGVDEVTVEVLRHKLDAIADEMQATLIQSAYSSIVKEANDASSAVFAPDGRTVAQAAAVPAHLGMLVPAIETIVEAFPPDEMRPDDVYLLNDPYDGGTHIPDLTVVKPIFVDGEVVALGATMAHHQEMGGKTPGSIPTDATEIYQEGLRFPPLKLHDEGEPNETLLSILRTNVRIPETVVGDLNAQISSVTTAERRVSEVAERYGNDTFRAAVDLILDHAEELTRTHLEEIPDGAYSFVDFVDDDGVNVHEPIRIEATVEVDGSDLHVDFSGTADQVTGPVNAVPAATLSAVYYVARAVTDPDIPNNAGCYAPISVTMPEGSVLNPRPPAPVNARSVTLKRVVDALKGALATAVPERIPAAGNGQLLSHRFSGFDPDGSQWIHGEVGAGGSGARPTSDGVDCIDTDVTNCMNTPVEATEMDAPLLIRQYELWADSGGPGRHRGGLGYRKRFEIRQPNVTFTHRRDRHDVQPWGLAGGEPAPHCRTEIHRAGGGTESIPSQATVSLGEGDVVDVFTTGGGGYGDPRERDVDALARDVRGGVVSPERAADAYGAVLAADGTVDVDATRRQRDPPASSPPEGAVAVDRGDLPRDAASSLGDD
jgi:N-methylhydantoinase B/oxoprolinase/acetone carboxylase alpha subunit